MRRFLDPEEAEFVMKLHGMDRCATCLERYAKYTPGNSALGLVKLLARYRERSGLSQTKAAKKCGLSAPQLSRFENGTRLPTIAHLFKIAQELHVEIIPVPKALVPSVLKLLQQADEKIDGSSDTHSLS